MANTTSHQRTNFTVKKPEQSYLVIPRTILLVKNLILSRDPVPFKGNRLYFDNAQQLGGIMNGGESAKIKKFI